MSFMYGLLLNLLYISFCHLAVRLDNLIDHSINLQLYEYRGKIKHCVDSLMNRERAPVHKLLPRDEHHWCALAPKHVVKIKRVS